jgi:exodeoxyribonuclease VII small subunit
MCQRERLTPATTLCTVAPSAVIRPCMTTPENNSLGGLEKSLEELEALVARLEGGDLPLEQALKEFERGVKLTRQCQTALQEAEQKIEILLRKTDQAEPSEFSPEDDGE